LHLRLFYIIHGIKKREEGGEKYKKFLEMATATRSGQKVITVGSEVI
jgi:hypothetical protein